MSYKVTAVLKFDKYEVTSYGNGAAYAVKRLADDASIFFQDEDAYIFNQEWMAFAQHESLEDALIDAIDSYSDIMEVNG